MRRRRRVLRSGGRTITDHARDLDRPIGSGSFAPDSTVWPDEHHWILKGENSRVFYREVRAWMEHYLR